MRQRWILVCCLAFGAVAARAGEGGLAARGGEVVSVDTANDRVTLKDQNDQTITIKAEGQALAMLGELTPGQRVRWAYRDDSSGQHQAIVWIKII